jgi:hypothetical protein
MTDANPSRARDTRTGASRETNPGIFWSPADVPLDRFGRTAADCRRDAQTIAKMFRVGLEFEELLRTYVKPLCWRAVSWPRIERRHRVNLERLDYLHARDLDWANQLDEQDRLNRSATSNDPQPPKAP